MTAEDFLSRLDGSKVKRTRRGVMVNCPGHADKSPSLSISEGDNGNVLIRCFAGCSAAEITAAMGLTLKDLFPDSDRNPDEIRRDRERRNKKRVAEEKKREREGARLDALREAEKFIRSAKDISNSHAWEDDKRDMMMNRLATAYALLDREDRS